MATPRSQIVDEQVTPFYHCVSRCVRRAFLCGEGAAHRKQWIEERLQALVELFAIDCAGFAIMDNHLHVLLRLDSRRAETWSNEEIAQRWLKLFPLRDVAGQKLALSEARVRQLASDSDWVARTRKRLGDLGWFMKCLKEPLARLANKEDGCSGAFWEGRFKSVAVLDVESLLATLAYIDLNPVAAGIAPTPEDSTNTSMRARIEHCRASVGVQGLRDDLSTQTADSSHERRLWLMPMDDTRELNGGRVGVSRGLTLSCYLRLVDATSRLLRDGKAHVDAAAAPIFERLGFAPSEWALLVHRLFKQGRPTACHFGKRQPLQAAAQRHGRRWHRNLVRYPDSRSRPAA
jgi:hypothetical protein